MNCKYPAITARMAAIARTPTKKKARRMQGRYAFCEGCHLNCYFDPSFNYRFNRLFFQSAFPKFSYIIMKYFIYGHLRSAARLIVNKTG